jgi:hypothetical protein
MKKKAELNAKKRNQHSKNERALEDFIIYETLVRRRQT